MYKKEKKKNFKSRKLMKKGGYARYSRSKPVIQKVNHKIDDIISAYSSGIYYTKCYSELFGGFINTKGFHIITVCKAGNLTAGCDGDINKILNPGFDYKARLDWCLEPIEVHHHSPNTKMNKQKMYFFDYAIPDNKPDNSVPGASLWKNYLQASGIFPINKYIKLKEDITDLNYYFTILR